MMKELSVKYLGVKLMLLKYSSRFLLVLVIFVCFCATVSADTVSVYRRSNDPTTVTTRGQQGKVVAMSPTEVSLERSANTSKIPVNEIISIRFDEDPPAMASIQLAIQTGDYETAEASLSQINMATITRPYIKQEVEFFKAYISAMKVLVPGKTPEEISKGAMPMLEFVKQNGENWHYFEANSILGDLMVARGTSDVALNYYQKLIDSPWPDMQLKGHLAVANIHLVAGELAQAKTGFEAIIGHEDKSRETLRQKSFAQIGLGRTLAKSGEPQQGITAVEEAIKGTTIDDYDLNALAYNALGDIHFDAAHKNEALLAYLHVDLLYSKARQEHIKALQKLAILWNEKGKIDRESEVRQTLQTRYGVTVVE